MCGRFESEFPGGHFLSELSQLVQCNLEFISQMLILLHAISRKRSPEREVLLCLYVVRGLVRCLIPSNGIGCSGVSRYDSYTSLVQIFGTAYIYWSNDCHFQRMKDLFGLAFSTQYRADLVTDGIASSIETGISDSLFLVFVVFIPPTEYQKSAERLGDVEVLEPTPWRTELQIAWYWYVLTAITSDLSMVKGIIFLILVFLHTFSGYVCADTSDSSVCVVHRFNGPSATSHQIYFVEHRTVF